jgi:hypothetical protein
MFPPGIIAWAKAAHSELDPWDESMRWIPRLVGSALIAFSWKVLTTVFSISGIFLSPMCARGATDSRHQFGKRHRSGVFDFEHAKAIRL